MSRTSGPSADAKAASAQREPLKPRPKMLIGLSAVFVLWVAFLLTMYFTTVYPNRYIEVRPGDTAGESPASAEA